MKARPGYRIVTIKGRGYPTAERAVEALRRALDRAGIEVPDEDIEARRWTEGGFCPWEAIAQIPDVERVEE